MQSRTSVNVSLQTRREKPKKKRRRKSFSVFSAWFFTVALIRWRRSETRGVAQAERNTTDELVGGPPQLLIGPPGRGVKPTRLAAARKRCCQFGVDVQSMQHSKCQKTKHYGKPMPKHQLNSTSSTTGDDEAHSRAWFCFFFFFISSRFLADLVTSVAAFNRVADQYANPLIRLQTGGGAMEELR